MYLGGETDWKSIEPTIVMNLLNVAGLAMKILKERVNTPMAQVALDVAALGCLLSDVAYRAAQMYFHRTAIVDKVKDIYQDINLRQAADSALQRIKQLARLADYPLRVIMTALTASMLFTTGFHLLQKVTHADSTTLAGIIALGGVACGLAKLTQISVHKALDQLGFQQTMIRDISEWTFKLSTFKLSLIN